LRLKLGVVISFERELKKSVYHTICKWVSHGILLSVTHFVTKRNKLYNTMSLLDRYQHSTEDLEYSKLQTAILNNIQCITI